MDNRIITLFQMNSDRSEFQKFVEMIKAAGLKQGEDFFTNPGGQPQLGIKAEFTNDSSFQKAKKKFAMQSINVENAEASSYVKESAYSIGDKVKVWMGGGRKALGEVKKIAFGDGFYFVEVAGRVVSRSLHELEPFIEGKDKTVKSVKKNLSLDEAVEKALQLESEDITEDIAETMDRVGREDDDINNDGTIDNTDDYLGRRREVISREKANMSCDEMVDEALNMYDESGGGNEYAGRSNCCDAPVYGETDICSKCKEHCEVIPDDEAPYSDEEEIEEDFTEGSGEFESPEQQRALEMYLSGRVDVPPVSDGQEELDEYESSDPFVKVNDSGFILGVKPPDEFGTMYIRFAYGVYAYHNVPDEIYDGLMSAPSAGKYFHANIRKVFPYELAKKYNATYAKGVKPKFAKKEDTDPSERNAHLVGKPMEEDHLSSRDERIKFIINNAEYLPMGTLSLMFDENPAMASEQVASYDDDKIASLYHGIELAMEEASVDHQMESVLGEEFSEGEAMEEGKDVEVVKEAKSTKRFEILAEDIATVTNIAALKGYKVVAVRGELVESKREGVMNILVEKAGRKATIVYNDNANVKPWSWNGTHFNFMQEALDTVYVTSKQILSEGKEIERNELKENSKKVDQLMEQRKYAAKTTKLSESEAQRRERRSKEILKKFMGDDLINREFDR